MRVKNKTTPREKYLKRHLNKSIKKWLGSNKGTNNENGD
jgi:hypothetical protein